MGVGSYAPGLTELQALTVEGRGRGQEEQGGWRGRSTCDRARWGAPCISLTSLVARDRGSGGLGPPWAAGARVPAALQGGAAPFTAREEVLTEPHRHQVRPGCALSPFYGGQQRAREGKPLPKGEMVELGISQGLSLCATCCQLLGKPRQRLFQVLKPEEARASGQVSPSSLWWSHVPQVGGPVRILPVRHSHRQRAAGTCPVPTGFPALL